MSSFVLWVLLLALWAVILFIGKSLGISVLLFILPLVIYMYCLLKKSDKVKNKYGLLFMIPIVLLSITYLLFNNSMFSVLNQLAIFVLFGLMYVYSMNKTEDIKCLFVEVISVLFEPLTYIGRFFRVSTYKLRGKFKFTDKSKKVMKSILIVFPIVLVIVMLLSSADMIFGHFFNNIFDKIGDFLSNELFDDFLSRFIYFVFIFFAIGCTSMYIMYGYPREKNEVKKESKKRDLFTIKLLFIVLNIIYVVFDFIQIKSLILHSVASNINYAEYARQGFFQLMIVSVINIAIILISKKFENKDNEKEFKFIKAMGILMVLLTIVIIISSFLRMNLYEKAFGYTTLRLLVYIALTTESILMIPTSMYIFNSDIDILKSYIVIILVAYVFANFIDINYLVARRNVDRYYAIKKIDIDYLKNYEFDNIGVLIELYDKTNDVVLKQDISNYFRDLIDINKEESSFFEYNVSKKYGIERIKKLELLIDNRDYSIE